LTTRADDAAPPKMAVKVYTEGDHDDAEEP
jgi:hypothetical protein